MKQRKHICISYALEPLFMCGGQCETCIIQYCDY